MDKFTQTLHSRTFWTVVIMILVNILPQLPWSKEVKDLITIILGLLATYYHVNPNQVYTPAGVTPPAPGQSVTVTQP